MGDFRQGGGNRFGGRGGGFGGGRGGRSDFRGPVTMHKVICDECKKPCEVPFLPTAGKPVYCNACFGGKREMVGGERGRGGDRFPRKNFGEYKTPARTDFGNDINKVSGAEIKKQLEILNTKMDKLIKAIETLTANSKPVVAEEKAKKTVKKVSKKK